MKNLAKVSVMLAILSLVTIGCFSKENKLVGVWTTTAGGCGNITMVFNSDHTGYLQTPLETGSFTWYVEGNELVIEAEDGTRGRAGFEIKDNVLIIHTPEHGDVIFYRQGR